MCDRGVSPIPAAARGSVVERLWIEAAAHWKHPGTFRPARNNKKYLATGTIRHFCQRVPKLAHASAKTQATLKVARAMHLLDELKGSWTSTRFATTPSSLSPSLVIVVVVVLVADVVVIDVAVVVVVLIICRRSGCRGRRYGCQ